MRDVRERLVHVEHQGRLVPAIPFGEVGDEAHREPLVVQNLAPALRRRLVGRHRRPRRPALEGCDGRQVLARTRRLPRSRPQRRARSHHRRAALRQCAISADRAVKRFGLSADAKEDEERRLSAEREGHRSVESGAQRLDTPGRRRMETVTQPLRSIRARIGLAPRPTFERREAWPMTRSSMS